MKIKKVTIKADFTGAENILKSAYIKAELDKTANKIIKAITPETNSESSWETEDSKRHDRNIVNVTIDDEKLKWREVADGKIAKKIKSMTRMGKK